MTVFLNSKFMWKKSRKTAPRFRMGPNKAWKYLNKKSLNPFLHVYMVKYQCFRWTFCFEEWFEKTCCSKNCRHFLKLELFRVLWNRGRWVHYPVPLNFFWPLQSAWFGHPWPSWSIQVLDRSPRQISNIIDSCVKFPLFSFLDLRTIIKIYFPPGPNRSVGHWISVTI